MQALAHGLSRRKDRGTCRAGGQAFPSSLVGSGSPWGPGVSGARPSRVGQGTASKSTAGRAGSGVTQTQEKGHRVPSGPFKGTFDLNPGAQYGGSREPALTESKLSALEKARGLWHEALCGIICPPWEAWNAGGKRPRRYGAHAGHR